MIVAVAGVVNVDALLLHRVIVVTVGRDVLVVGGDRGCEGGRRSMSTEDSCDWPTQGSSFRPSS